MSEHIHTIPVDPALSPRDAWFEMCLYGRRTTYTGEETWTSVRCDGEECRLLDLEDVSGEAEIVRTDVGPVVVGWCDEHLQNHRLIFNMYAWMDDGPHRIGTYAGCDKEEADD